MSAGAAAGTTVAGLVVLAALVAAAGLTIESRITHLAQPVINTGRVGGMRTSGRPRRSEENEPEP